MAEGKLNETYLSGYESMISSIKNYDFLTKNKEIDWKTIRKKTILVWGREGKENYYVSYIVPTYNRPHLLRQTLKSILKQPNIAKYEIIITDNTEPEKEDVRRENYDVIRSFNDSRVKYYQNIKTVSDNWNV